MSSRQVLPFLAEAQLTLNDLSKIPSARMLTCSSSTTRILMHRHLSRFLFFCFSPITTWKYFFLLFLYGLSWLYLDSYSMLLVSVLMSSKGIDWFFFLVSALSEISWQMDCLRSTSLSRKLTDCCICSRSEKSIFEMSMLTFSKILTLKTMWPPLTGSSIAVAIVSIAFCGNSI